MIVRVRSSLTMREHRTRSIPVAEKVDWLRLIRSENVGPVTFFRLIEHFGSATAALDALPHLARRGGRAKAITVCPRAAAEAEFERVAAIGARLIAWGEPEYPPLLTHVEDAPPLLLALGHVHLLTKAAVAVVGARNASVAGCRFAGEIAADLGRGGLMVVSGMARGIDAAAHAGALDTGTAAVLGGGIDVVYPRENAALYESIRERGVLVSETEPGTAPQPRHFPRRNRIISGIARGVVVIEATLRSGSLITARLAADQGREVFAIPGSPMDPRSRGANNLLRQGAVLTESADDVLQVLRQSAQTPLMDRKGPEFQGKGTATADEREVDTARAGIAVALGPVPVTVDEIVRNCQFSPAAAMAALLELELAGRLERHPGNRVSLISVAE